MHPVQCSDCMGSNEINVQYSVVTNWKLFQWTVKRSTRPPSLRPGVSVSVRVSVSVSVSAMVKVSRKKLRVEPQHWSHKSLTTDHLVLFSSLDLLKFSSRHECQMAGICIFASPVQFVQKGLEPLYPSTLKSATLINTKHNWAENVKNFIENI